MQFDVFLSHNSKDKPAVRELVRQLANRNIRVWLDEDQLIPGRNWQPLLEEGIAQSRTGAVVVGQDGLGPWEDEEMQSLLRQAATSGKPVIPVLLPQAPTKPKLPLFLGNRTWVDLRKGFTDQGMDKLVWGITGTPPGTRLAEAQHHEGYGMGVRTWWTWLLDKEHRAAVGFVGAGIAAVIAAGWAAFVHFDERPEPPASPPSVAVSADRGGIAASRDVNVTAEGGGAATLQTGDGRVSIGSAPGEAQVPPATSPPPAAAVPKPASSGIKAGGTVSVEAKEGSTATLQTGSGSIHIQQEASQ